MNTYRCPAGHRPILPQSPGRVRGLLAASAVVALLAVSALLLLSTLARVACGPAAHPAPATLDHRLASPHHDALVARHSEQAGHTDRQQGAMVAEVDL